MGAPALIHLPHVTKIPLFYYDPNQNPARAGDRCWGTFRLRGCKHPRCFQAVRLQMARSLARRRRCVTRSEEAGTETGEGMEQNPGSRGGFPVLVGTGTSAGRTEGPHTQMH